MTQIPLGIGAYSRPFGRLPEIRLENRFFEQNPVGAEKTTLLSRPGTSLFLEVGAGPIRTLYSQSGVFGGDLFIVSGTKLYRYSGGSTTLISGDVLGEGYPVMTSVAIPGWEALFISDGLTLQHYAGPSGGVHALVLSSVPDDVGIVDLSVLASYVICIQEASHKYFWIRPGATDIQPLDFNSAESEPDEILNITVVGDMLWLFGQSSTEAWYLTGDAEAPFMPARGRAFSQGILSGTLARVQDTIVVVGQDRVAYKIAGTPERISHHGIEEMLRQWQETGDLRVTISYVNDSERTIALSAGSSTPASVVSYSWDFGDGSPLSTAATPTHTYAALGFYTVKLTVVDSNGLTGTASRVINVTTLLVAPTGLAGAWSRTGAAQERVTLSWSDPTAYVAALPRRVYWNGFLIADLAAGVGLYVHDNAHLTDPLVGEAANDYLVLFYEGAEEGLTAEISAWSGPPAPTGVTVGAAASQRAYIFPLSWTGSLNPAIQTDVDTSYLCVGAYSAASGSPFGRNGLEELIRVGYSPMADTINPEVQGFDVRIRAKVASFGVTDFSDYVTRVAEVVGDTGEVDGFNTCPP